MNDKKIAIFGRNGGLSSTAHGQRSFNQRSQRRDNKKISSDIRNPKSANCWHLVDETDTNEKDVNNNENTIDSKCICFRSRMAYECGRCHQYFHGRLAEVCPIHTSDVFLMDFQHCPYCAAPLDMIEKSKLSWEQIRKFEEAELPGGDEGL